eukprot:m.114723 g.114723  ORF g.114723 m.114723 type:complete len:158 (-) comp13549_c0_seq3:2100-2573(-)
MVGRAPKEPIVFATRIIPSVMEENVRLPRLCFTARGGIGETTIGLLPSTCSCATPSPSASKPNRVVLEDIKLLVLLPFGSALSVPPPAAAVTASPLVKNPLGNHEEVDLKKHACTHINTNDAFAHISQCIFTTRPLKRTQTSSLPTQTEAEADSSNH